MNCIIVDDDQMARVSLEMLCEKIEDVIVDSIFDNGLDALNWLKENETDVIFLDIEMPSLSGMDLIKSIDNLPQIVFTTSHAEYALEAFEYQVTDFVPKPVQLPRFLKAIERVRELNNNVRQESQNEIFIRHEGRFVRLNLEELLYVESLGDYVTFVTNDKKYIVHSTLKNIADKITNPNFLKVHRSYVINLTKVVDIEENNLVIKDKVIPISRAHKSVLIKRIKPI